MSKREKIIVALMVLSVLYGGYALLLEPGMSKSKKPESDNTSVSLQNFVTEIAQNLAGANQSEKSAYILKMAETEWEKNPFLETELKTAAIEEKDAVNPEQVAGRFFYSGFLRMGRKNMAIINGMEYEVGELLENTGHVVKKITPTQVVVGIADSEKNFVLILNETE